MRFIAATEVKADQQFRYGGQKFKAISTEPGAAEGTLKVMAATTGADGAWAGELIFYPGQQVTLIGEGTDHSLLASRITQSEVQAFLDATNAQMMNAGMTRVEVLPQMKDPSAESITYRWQQNRTRTILQQPELGWVTVGRGEQGQIVLLESTSDWDKE